MELNFSNIAIIVASSQSFLLAVLIFQKHRALFANRFLAALMLCYSTILVHLILQDAGLYQTFLFAYIIVGTPLAASPLQFLYTKYLLNRSLSFARNDWIHFLPVGILEIILIVVLLSGGADDISAASTSGPATTPLLFRIFNGVLIVQGLSYMIAGLRLIIRYNRHLKDILSSIEKIQMNWLRNITIAGLTAWSLFLIEDSLMTQGINLSNFIFVSVVFAIYVYAMGFVGLMKSEIFASPDVEQTMHHVSEITDKEFSSSSTKYEKSGLSQKDAERYMQQLLQIMEVKKPFLDPSLTLSQLAEMLAVSPHNLSEVINTQTKKNFYDFVNSYRIKQVKKDLTDPEKQHLKIISVAFDAGFNSKASFNTIFKEQENMTPSEFKKRILKITAQ